MSKRENPVDHVLDRMVEAVLGENAHFKSHAEVLGIPPETIKTWRRRREVPAAKLAAFAQDWKVSVDWLLHGPDGELLMGSDAAHLQAAQRVPDQYGALADDERKLLDNYRNSPDEVKEALQLVASIASRPQSGPPPQPPRVKVRSGVLPTRKFDPSNLKVRSGDLPEASSSKRRKKKRGDDAA